MLVAGSPERSQPLEEDAAPPTDPSPPESTPEPAASEPEHAILSLEDRVRRLEDVIASLQLLTPEAVAAGRAERPAMETAASDAVAPPAQPPARLPTQPWLLLDIYAELRCVPRMFFDPRYRLSWYTLLLTPLLIAALVLSRWVLGHIWLVGGALDFIVYTILFYVLFKVLSREATHYRTTSPDLPPTLRL